jgi:hypothetical protein
MEFIDKEEVFAVMSQVTSLVGWNQFIMYFVALVWLWYIYSAVKLMLAGKSKLAEALRTFGLGIAWPSMWAIYNPQDFAALVPFLARASFVLGVAGFLVGMLWTAKVNFKGFKRSPKSASASTTTS